MNFTPVSNAECSADADYNIHQKRCSVMSIEFCVKISFPSDGFMLNHKFLFGVSAALTLVVVLMNLTTVFTFWRSPRLKDRISHFLIMLQSVSDLLIGAFNISFFTYHLAGEILGDPNCFVVFVSFRTGHVFFGCSLTSLFLINLERYIGILHPLAHKAHWTKKRMLACGACHILPWLACSVIHMYNRTVKYYYDIHLVVYCIVVVYIYIRIYYAVKTDPFQAQSRPTQSSTESANPINNGGEILSAQARNAAVSLSDKQKRLKEAKLARSCFVVVVCFFVCHTPVGLSIGLKIPGFLGSTIRSWAFLISASSLFWNSLIFVWRDRMLRAEVKRVMSGCFCKWCHAGY